jgi:hypothetical protein
MNALSHGSPQALHKTSHMTPLTHGSSQALHKTKAQQHNFMVSLRLSTKQNKPYDCINSWFLSGPLQNKSYITASFHDFPQALHKTK